MEGRHPLLPVVSRPEAGSGETRASVRRLRRMAGSSCRMWAEAMRRGKLITFEGIDGCGKTTQMRLLGQYLTERGVAVVPTREPGGTELGRKVRSALLDGGTSLVEPLAELLLYADRAQHVRRVILPALAEGKVVLSDRFYDATTVYQGYARGFDLKLVNQLNELATGGLNPDLTLLFDLDVETGLKRHRG